MSALNFSLNVGDHVCHFFEGFGEQKALVLPFVKEGLANGEYCLLVTVDQPVHDWYFEFQAYGIDVQAELDRGALQVIAGADWRQTGDFVSVVKARELWRLIEDKLGSFSGVRIVGDAAWALEPPMPVGDLCHWEATANLVYERANVRVICQYNLTKQPAAAVHAALRTHPLAILKGNRYSNPYCEASRILENEPNLNEAHADAAMVESMLTRLTTLQ